MEIAPVALNLVPLRSLAGPAALAKLEAAADGIARVCFAIPPELVDSAWMGTGPGACSTRWIGTAGSLCGFSRFTTSFVTSVD